MARNAEFLRVKEVALQLGVSPRRAYQLVRDGELPATRVGGAIRIPRDAWLVWLDCHRKTALGGLRQSDTSPGDVTHGGE